MRQVSKPFHFSVGRYGYHDEAAVAVRYLDDYNRSFLRITFPERSLLDVREVDVYWWKPREEGPRYWFERATKSRTELSMQIGEGIEQALLELEYWRTL